jgi:hypothetical protein
MDDTLPTSAPKSFPNESQPKAFADAWWLSKTGKWQIVDVNRYQGKPRLNNARSGSH